MPLSSRDLCRRRGQERAERSKPVSLWPGWRPNEEVVDACYTGAPSAKVTMPGRAETALEFGELKDVTLRDVWGNEAQHFTPWLAANMERLSEAIGIPLESEGTEVAVEQFSADIVARNPADGSRVLIENQLEGSDHRHLGQILTYLAGVQAQTVIWVARDFDESHRSAIRWLNDHTASASICSLVTVTPVGYSPASSSARTRSPLAVGTFPMRSTSQLGAAIGASSLGRGAHGPTTGGPGLAGRQEDKHQ